MEYLKVCWFCGSEFEDIEKCHICRQEFCSSHLKPEFHDCPGELIQNPYMIDFGENNFDKLDNTQETQFESNSHTDFDTTESVVNYYQCWFCGIGISEIFYCEKCNQYYCEIHKELEKHDCISLFDQSKIESHLPIQEENFNKINKNEQFLELDRIIVKKKIELEDISFSEYMDVEEDLFTGENLSHKIVVKSKISVSKRSLTYLFEHASKTSPKKCSGLLLGKRNEEGMIQVIDGNIALGSGTRSIFVQNSLNIFRTLKKFLDSEYNLVGWYHSHPGQRAPTFSALDRPAHIMYSTIFSLYYYRKSLKKSMLKRNVIEMLLHLSHLKVNQLAYFIKVIFSIINHPRLLAKLDRIIDHWVKISYRHVGISTMNPTYSFVKNPEAISHLNEEFSSHFTSMKKDVEKHVLGQKKELLPLKECIIPVVGAVICPDIRMIGALDWFFTEKEQEFQTEFGYYQLKLKDD